MCDRGREGSILLRAAAGLLTASFLTAAATRGLGAQEEGPPPDARPAAPAADDPARKRIEALEKQIASLRLEIAALKANLPKVVAGAPDAAALRALETQVAALEREVARLASAPSAAAGPPGPAPAEPRAAHGLGPVAGKIYGVKHGSSIGAYAEFLYENFTGSRDDDTPSNAVNRADVVRAVVALGHRFDDRFLFNSEVEIEHAAVGGGTGPGQVALEFAYLDYRHRENFGARGGLLLVPLGFLNERHEPGEYFGARRPEVERLILPATWREIGGGVYGQAGPVEYRGYLVTGLDAAGFSEAEGVRGGQQGGAAARASNLALTARADWRPAEGWLLGAGAFTGGTDQNNPGFPTGRLTMWEAHAEWTWRGLRARALAVQAILADAGDVSLAIDGTGATAIGERLRGFYAEIGYNVLTAFRGTRQEVVPFCRYESLDTQARVAPGLAADPANDLTVKTCGVTWRPIPGVILKVDAQNFYNQARTAVDQVNLGLACQF